MPVHLALSHGLGDIMLFLHMSLWLCKTRDSGLCWATDNENEKPLMHQAACCAASADVDQNLSRGCSG